MKPASPPRWLIALIAVVVIALVGYGLMFMLSPKPLRYGYTEGTPLLQLAEGQFTDTQLGLQFAPPKDWAMQARTTESSGAKTTERTVVKFKRLRPNVAAAWFKVVVKDVSEDQTPVDFLRQRKPPEKDWKVAREVERNLMIASSPAARITFSGPYDPDGRGTRDFSNEITAVRRGARMFEFSGTFPTSEAATRNEIRAVIESVVLTK